MSEPFIGPDETARSKARDLIRGYLLDDAGSASRAAAFWRGEGSDELIQNRQTAEFRDEIVRNEQLAEFQEEKAAIYRRLALFLDESEGGHAS